MKIMGLQKSTLLDYPRKVACTVFTGGCNFLCPFCHNAELICPSEDESGISRAQLHAFLKKRKNILDGVCISGGEPLIHSELAELIREIKELGYLVKLDTNGSFPEKLKELAGEGLLDYVAMDIKNSKYKYARTAGMEALDIRQIEESVRFLMEGSLPFEFRTTVVRQLHTKEDMLEIGAWIAGKEPYFLQTFEPSHTVPAQGFTAYEREEMAELAGLLREQLPNVELRGI
ncbi:anaerobic ribonucleoside-triphosphate reductase activating protein [Anaerostipes sp.]|uniref:anaerobic ribonucleoside-triphosphate reductase activating protein n=1 Tax=Anaerostipes sp. TaxID=1872530 RepID=UPI0025C2F98B|nr:anaerobic ribonucleoside-triphosphate reductase activating protein [Anaerostipes sp.]MBS7008923.1 anaerobic ribonucleoside-triphosphate reductase activating protein [Anaerostipes sp.]